MLSYGRQNLLCDTCLILGDNYKFCGTMKAYGPQAAILWKSEKNKTFEQINSQNKLRENLFPKISVRTSRPELWISRC